MKRVVKHAEPAAFAAWKAKASDEWQPTYADLRNPEKRVSHTALLAEQAGVCCYCGRRISLADSHIEHFRPQEAFKNLALDHGNLHASCIREASPGKPLHCGHAKGSVFDKERVISPQDADCERRFIYSLDGAIEPANEQDASAIYMLGLLRLDIGFLRERRAVALRSVFDNAFIDSASDEELAQLAKAYRSPDASDQMLDFGHALARFAEQLLGRPV